MPWNLPLWYLHRRLRLAIELDCDARVLAGGAEVTRYGDVLVQAGARTTGGRLPALAAFAERATQLGARIDAMTRARVSRPIPRALGAALVAAVLLVAACSFENPLGIDLTTATQPVEVRVNPVYLEGVQFEMIRMLARPYPRISYLASTRWGMPCTQPYPSICWARTCSSPAPGRSAAWRPPWPGTPEPGMWW
jgi:hypothetical protein